MALLLESLDRAALRSVPANIPKSYDEARRLRKSTAFLSHSHLDARRAKGLQTVLAEQGWEVFIDWDHLTLDQRPTRETVEFLQRAILDRDWLIYLATPNASKSRWCPWEIGFADGKKSLHAIVVVETSDGNATYGSEYLHLYRSIREPTGGHLKIFEAGGTLASKRLSEAAATPSARL